MRLFIVSVILLSLSSCSLPFNTTKDPAVSGEETKVNSNTTAVVEKIAASGNLVTLNYTLRDATDKKVLESTLQAVSEANNIGKPGANYQPFQVMIGQWDVIPGFEKGLIGLKKGDKKTISVSPEEGYGTGARMREVAKYQIAPVFTMKQPKELFNDTITQTVPREKLTPEMKNVTLGQTLTGANGSTAKVKALDETSITFEIDNVDNPFYKKPIKVGATSEDANGWATFKIQSIDDKEVTLEVTNKNSPFYNKKFAVGELLSLPEGAGKITIVAITDEMVTIAEEHPMMGKSLEFEVDIVDVQ